MRSAANLYWKSEKRHFRLIVSGMAALAVALFFLSLCMGRYSSGLPPAAVWKLLTGLGNIQIPDLDRDVFFNIRLPRVAGALAVGGAMSAAGCVYQSLFRNPLVSPDILGVSSGASFGAILALFLGLHYVLIRVSAFVFGIGAVAFTGLLNRLFSKGQANQTASLLLTGLLCSSFLTAMYTILHFLLEMSGGRDLPSILFWSMGSLGSLRIDTLWPLLSFIAVGLVPLVLLRWRLNALSFSDEEARALGVHLGRMRALMHLCATVITAAIVATCGTVGWVAVIMPHFARLAVGSDFRKTLPVSILMGGSFLLLADGICRSALAQEIPLSIITSLVGAPVFIALFLHNTGKEAMG